MDILSNLAIKFDKFIDSFDNKMSIKKNVFADDNGNLNNPNNPFNKESNKIIKNENLDQSINNINLNNNSISNENKIDISNNSLQKHKRGKYKKRYFYFDIDNKTYRYICENKSSVNKLKFKCSDTKCPAQEKNILKWNINLFLILIKINNIYLAKSILM